MIINKVFICVSIVSPKRFASWHRSPFFVRLRAFGEFHRAECFIEGALGAAHDF
jgi:hypothetical protein